ncbi:conjugal transfer protein TrbF, partial [Escherichia coli]
MSFFKKKEQINQSINNPYLNAKTEWLERYGDYISRARNWQIVAI